MTVEAHPVRVESRLSAGGITCPACGAGVLAGWGFARTRRTEGVAGLAAATVLVMSAGLSPITPPPRVDCRLFSGRHPIVHRER